MQSVPYIDPQSRQDRETDVLAEFPGVDGVPPVSLVIECKRAQGKHWVTFPFDEGRISSQPVMHHALTDGKDFIRVGLLEEAWASGPTIFGPQPSIATALVEADLGRDGGSQDKNERDTAANALRQCWSAARGLLVETGQTQTWTRIIVPVVVTGAQLWTCRLASDGAGDLVVAETDYARVRAPGVSSVLVHIMGPDRFPSFAQQVAELQTRSWKGQPDNTQPRPARGMS